MTTSAQDRTAVSWPLARRIPVGLAEPGGRRMAERALDGAGLDDGSRVVELAPGLGIASDAVLARDPRTWTAVEPDPLAAEHLRRARAARGGLPIPGREGPTRTRVVVEAPVDRTGLPDETATVVVADSLMSLQEDAAGRRAILGEARRLLRAGGRVVVHDLTLAPGAAPGAAADLAAVGIRPPTEAGLRADLEAAGFVVVGALVAALDLPAVSDIAKEAGPRLGLKVTREIATDPALRSAAMKGRDVLPRHAVSLRSLMIVGEAPLILGLLRPGR